MDRPATRIERALEFYHNSETNFLLNSQTASVKIVINADQFSNTGNLAEQVSLVSFQKTPSE
jgi:hypothetical protein